jgi:hypothetical protein
MDDQKLEIGDRVITLQVPGIFRVIARDGDILTIESIKGGVRLTKHESALRRPLDDVTDASQAEPSDDPA